LPNRRNTDSESKMNEESRRVIDVLFKPRKLFGLFREYFRLGQWSRSQPIRDLNKLAEFLRTRASYVAQVSLYGYLRTRAGTRYPELFDDDPFVRSINIAKWQIWLSCLSDLAVYAGGLLRLHTDADSKIISGLMLEVIDTILEETGIPADAGDAFSEHARQLRQRVEQTDWSTVTDDEAPFSESPSALVQWAPIVDELKQLDEEIVRNSVRFRWQKVRQELRGTLDTAAILANRI